MPTLADKIKPYLDQLRDRELTNRAVAKLLGVSEEHVCRVLKRLKFVKNPPPDRQQASQLYRARQEYRRHVATTLSITDAARAAGCSVRTIYRLRHVAQKPQPDAE